MGYNKRTFKFSPLSDGNDVLYDVLVELEDFNSDEYRSQDFRGDFHDCSSGEISDIFHEIHEQNLRNLEEEEEDLDSKDSNDLYPVSGTISKKTVTIIGLIVGAIWFIGLLIYSNGKVTQISDLSWKTNITLANSNITLNQYDPKFKNLTMEQYRKGVYQSYEEPIKWLLPSQFPSSGKSGGFYLTVSQQKLVTLQVDKEFQHIVLDSVQFSYKNKFYYLEDIILNPSKAIDDASANHIVVTDIAPKWRHLSFALYWLYNAEKETYIPINALGDENPSKIEFAYFSPKGDLIVFGLDNDLYLYDINEDKVRRITDNGSPHIFNGKTDWVYEEEILGDNKMFWWSSNQETLIFTTLNDTLVHDFKLDYYIKNPKEVSDDTFNLYPKSTIIKYPKPGTPNPLISFNKYNFKDETVTEIETTFKDSLLYEAIWLNDDNFMIKTTDRASRVLTKRVYLQSESESFEVVQVINATSEYSGWFEKMHPITLLQKGEADSSYIDQVVIDGRTHLALFDEAKSASYSKLITKGDWNIHHDTMVVYDKRKNFVYAFATIKSSMDSHFIGIDLDKEIIIPMTSTDIDGYYSGDFTSDGQYVSLNYKGPDLPWQRLVNMGDIHDYVESDEYTVGDSCDKILKIAPTINHVEITTLNLKDTNIPTKTHLQIKVGQYSDKSPILLNVIQILPPNFDPKTKKYPLLVYAYGGPGSQTVDKQHGIDFQMIASSTLDAVVLIIDPRGTGGQGWKFKSFATDNLGYWEARDITTIVSEYIGINKYINKEKTALWGWSYGGFTTLKTLEYDAGKTVKFGIAVAPVTNWLFYDSVYTERYFNEPNENYDKNGKISNYENFSSVNRFMMIHGTSDDNVHLQNLLWLLDKFNLANVENYDVHFFPDSDHSIQFHNAQSVVYDKILHWLQDAFTGKFEALYKP